MSFYIPYTQAERDRAHHTDLTALLRSQGEALKAPARNTSGTSVARRSRSAAISGITSMSRSAAMQWVSLLAFTARATRKRYSFCYRKSGAVVADFSLSG